MWRQLPAMQKKWENLTTRYKKIMQPPTGKGLEGKTHGAHGWPFFREMNKFMSSRHVINALLLIQSYTPNQAASSASAHQTLDSSMCSSTAIHTLPQGLISSKARTLTRPSSTPSPLSSSFPSLDSLQLSPPYSPGRSSSCSPLPTLVHSPSPSSGSPHPTPAYSPNGPSPSSFRPTSYSPYPSPFSFPQHSSSCSPIAQSSSRPAPYLPHILQDGATQPSNNHPPSTGKRRRPASTNKDAISDLVTLVQEDLAKQDRD